MNILSRMMNKLRPIETPIGPSTTKTRPGAATRPLDMIGLAQVSNQTQYRYENSKQLVPLIQGTIAACIRARASERGVGRLIVKEFGNPNTAIALKLTALLSNPNPSQTRTDFMETLSQHYDVTGNAVILAVNDANNMPGELWIMPSYFVDVITEDLASPIPAWYVWSDSRVKLPATSIVHIRNNSIKTAPYKGRGIMQDDQITAMIYDSLLKSQKNNLDCGGAPNVALKIRPDSIMTADQIKELQAQWRERYNSVTGTTNVGVLNDGTDLVNFGIHELDYAASKADIRDSIREAYQTPKIILGDTDNVNHNNGQTALAMFERLVVLRFLNKAADAFENYFQKSIHPKITVEIDPRVIQNFTQLPQQNGVIQSPQNLNEAPETNAVVNA